MQKTKTKVKIDGIEYTVTGSESEEYLCQLASYVDKKIKQTRIQCESLNSTLVAVLTAVNIADEYHKQKRLNQALEKQINELLFMSSEIGKAKKTKIKPLNINL